MLLPSDIINPHKNSGSALYCSFNVYTNKNTTVFEWRGALEIVGTIVLFDRTVLTNTIYAVCTSKDTVCVCMSCCPFHLMALGAAVIALLMKFDKRTCFERSKKNLPKSKFCSSSWCWLLNINSIMLKIWNRRATLHFLIISLGFKQLIDL